MLSIKEPEINVLNSCDKPPQHQKTAVDISKELQRMMLQMKSEFMSHDGNTVEYEALKTSSLYKEYKISTYNLHSLDLGALSEKEKQAFFINIYNALNIHGLANCKTLPSSVLDVQLFWKVTTYKIGGHTFSLDDIEHGILRGNQPHPSAKKPQFESNDPRLAYVVKQRDPRIHFALACGAKSCPAIQVYTAENVERALEAATRSFCEQEVKVYDIQREIRVSQIFQWYQCDFGDNDIEAIRWTIPYLSDEKAKVLKRLLYKIVNEGMVDLNYTQYNWGLNKKEDEVIEVECIQPGGSSSGNPSPRDIPSISPRGKKLSPRDKKISPRDKKKQ